jgi:hypothetical protein
MIPELSGSKTRKDLAKMYKIHPNTFDKRIKPIKPLLLQETRKRVYMPKDCELIYEHLGLPVHL